ncbi:hypothetical protein JTB14_011819 [Gonioctena quinquepunctata]|nr:hypothetical protein JTB14_011819 [Gonioctena quinquepunctata]
MTIDIGKASKTDQGGVVGVYRMYDLDVFQAHLEEHSDGSIGAIEGETKILATEKWHNITIQVCIPFFIAGIGTIGAGLIMANVTEQPVFKEIQALYVLVPALLGLKGNLDMCLASRLSTQANLGNMQNRRELFKMIIGNLSLVQVQAIVCSCIVSVFAVAGSALVNGNFEWLHTLLLATASTLTATLSCFVLDLVLISVIVISHKVKLNPDNLATPMAASIGDVVSLVTLATWAKLLFDIHDSHPCLMAGILATYVFILLPIWVFISNENKYTKLVLRNGWIPVISALFISGTGGLILDLGVDEFKGYTVFQPIINGIAGNLVSVQASRISTLFHETSSKGLLPPNTRQWVTPWTALITGVQPARTARILLSISIPGHTVFVFIADFMYKGKSTLTPAFVFIYLFVGLVQLIFLLYVCHLMVHTMWKNRMDPDNSAIPYLTALGDLSGSTLLLLGFFFLRFIHQEYQPIH